MSSEGRHHGALHLDEYCSEQPAQEAGRRSTLAVPHPMRPYHVDKLSMVVNERATNGMVTGYDGYCKATGAAITRTYVETKHDVKNEDGVVTHTDTRLDIVPFGYRDKDAR